MLIWVESADKAEVPRLSSPQPPPSAILGERQGVPKPAQRLNLIRVPWVYPGASAQLDKMKHHLLET